jgi:hypothetical protein
VNPRTAQFYAANAADLARGYIAAGSAPARRFPIACGVLQEDKIMP